MSSPPRGGRGDGDDSRWPRRSVAAATYGVTQMKMTVVMDDDDDDDDDDETDGFGGGF